MISIGNVAFGQCTGLTNITIPASVSNIEYQSFYGCSSLTSINVEEGNTEYDSRNNCNAIIKTSDGTLVKGCESTFIPQGVKTIGSYAFYSCAGLSAIDIPSSVSSIGESAFSGCNNLQSVNFNGSMDNIDEYAFYGCV